MVTMPHLCAWVRYFWHPEQFGGPSCVGGGGVQAVLHGKERCDPSVAERKGNVDATAADSVKLTALHPESNVTPPPPSRTHTLSRTHTRARTAAFKALSLASRQHLCVTH